MLSVDKGEGSRESGAPSLGTMVQRRGAALSNSLESLFHIHHFYAPPFFFTSRTSPKIGDCIDSYRPGLFLTGVGPF